MSNCHIYFYDGWMTVSPTTIGFAKAIAKHFENVYIYARKTKFKDYHFEEENIFVQYIKRGFCFTKAAKYKHFENKVKKALKQNNFDKDKDWFVCIDAVSLKPAYNLVRNCDNIMYLTLEIPLESAVFSDEECQMFAKSKIIMCQDEMRMKILEKVYRTKIDRTKQLACDLVNNSPKTSAKHKNLVSAGEQFTNIPEGKAKCACIGMIENVVCSYEIANAFNGVDNGVLIFHDRSKINPKKSYVKKVMKCNTKNTYYSQMTYDFEDIEYAYKGYDIGIACYKADDERFRLIGKSSGKMNYYLMYNIPLIVNKLDGYSDVIEKYNCGVVINDINNSAEWSAAINTIMSDYEGFKARTQECYTKEFDFREQIKVVENYLDNIL